MSAKRYRVVGRMEGLWPHQLAKYQMHRLRQGGDLGHVDPTRKNKLLVGEEDWAEKALARIDEIRYQNYNRELAALEKRKRKKEMMTRMVEGPRDPWRDSAHGPMREMILTANKDFFLTDLNGFFGQGASLEQWFEILAIDWLQRTFGDDLVHARADLDETAYHIHAVILPITATSVAVARKIERHPLRPAGATAIVTAAREKAEVQNETRKAEAARARRNRDLQRLNELKSKYEAEASTAPVKAPKVTVD